MQRLRNRGQDDEQIIARRMRDAVTEIRHHDEFDYLVVNDDFALALTELKSIIIANRLTSNASCLTCSLIGFAAFVGNNKIAPMQVEISLFERKRELAFPACNFEKSAVSQT